jgi:hypothetical protein
MKCRPRIVICSHSVSCLASSLQESHRQFALETKDLMLLEDALPDLVGGDGVGQSTKGEEYGTAAPPMPEPPSKPSPKTATKRCSVCTKNIQNPIILPACLHVLCPTCRRHTAGLQCCLHCQKCDPTLEALQTLPYVRDLQEPPPAVLHALMNEYLCHRNIETMEAIESKHQKEMKKLEKETSQAIRNAKETIRTVREQVTDRASRTLKDAKAKLEE